MKTLIAILTFIFISTVYPCDNICYRKANKKSIHRIATWGHHHKPTKKNRERFEHMRQVLDAICDRGFPFTEEELRFSKIWHLTSPERCRRGPVPTPTPHPTATPHTPTPTPTPHTPTPTPTPHTPTPTPHASPTPTPIPTPHPTTTPNPSPTPTATATATATPRHSPTPTPTHTPRPSPTPTPTATPSPSGSPTPSSTPSVTPTPSPTCTPHGECVLTNAEWREIPDEWPITEVSVGNTTYNQEQCLTIMSEDAGQNGLIAVAKVQITAKLNIANGAGHDCIDQRVIEADVLVGNLVVPPFGNGFIPLGNVQELVFALGQYSKGESCCAEHCDL